MNTALKIACVSLTIVTMGYNAARAQINCTSSTFMGNTTTRCSDGTTSQSNTFMGQTQTTITPPPPMIQPVPYPQNALPPAFGYNPDTWRPQ